MSGPPEAARLAAAPGLLCQVSELAAWLPGEPLAIIDCRFDLARPDAGLAAYRQAHIPGARYAHLDHDLAGPRTALSGRHPLPSAAAFAAACGRLGIGPGTPVVAYDDASGAFAARLWWLLRYFGHARVRLLDGGLAAWRAAGLPMAIGDPSPPDPAAAPFVPGPPLERTVEAEQIARGAVGRLIDARAADRFAGRSEPIDPVAGHVPGAVNVPFAAALAADQRFRSPEALRELFAAALAGRPPPEAAVMCGSGVTACHGLFALALAGLPGAALYPGSWSEWIRDPARPVERE